MYSLNKVLTLVSLQFLIAGCGLYIHGPSGEIKVRHIIELSDTVPVDIPQELLDRCLAQSPDVESFLACIQDVEGEGAQ